MNEANRRLAGLLGWTNIVDVGGALLGMPPPGEPECRGQAQVPDWTSDWRACEFLVSNYEVGFEVSNFPASGKYFAYTRDGYDGAFSDSLPHAVVCAACQEIERRAEELHADATAQQSA